MRHPLKCWPEFFQAIVERKKTFEVRKNDRDFKVGDTLRLYEYDPKSKTYTGRVHTVEVTYIAPMDRFGMKGIVAMSIR